MLGIMGLLGALMAGVVGDALMSMMHKDDDDDAAAADDAETRPPGADLLTDEIPATDTTDMIDTIDTIDPIDTVDAGTAFPEGTSRLADDDPAEDVPLPQDEDVGDTIIGADADEFIMGTAAADLIDGAGGADTIDGGGDADTLSGGAGDDRLTSAEDNAADHVLGGDGDDALQIGAGDTAWGNTGNDLFTLSDYAPGGPPAVIADYAPGEDRIVLMYDADLHPEPVVHTEAIEGTEDVSVLLDGIQIAIVQGAAGLDWEDIQLMAA